MKIKLAHKGKKREERGRKEEYSLRGINNSIKLTCAIHWGATESQAKCE